jgi:hypothetical protein
VILPISFAVLVIFLGYAAVVGCSPGMTLALTSAAPQFVEGNHCVRGPYKLAQAASWLVCTAVGGFVTAWMGNRSFARLEGMVLAGVLITVLWGNTWEVRQRGLAHQILLTALTMVRMSVGYMFRHQIQRYKTREARRDLPGLSVAGW